VDDPDLLLDDKFYNDLNLCPQAAGLLDMQKEESEAEKALL